MSKSLRIGILTSGGDCPGLNAVIRAVVVRGIKGGHQVVGIQDGWNGRLNPRVTLFVSRVRARGW